MKFEEAARIKKNVDVIAAAFPDASDPTVPRPAPYLVTLERLAHAPADAPPSRDDVVNHLIKGDVSASHVGRDLANDTHNYFVSRDAINSRADSLGSKPERILLHANLGNGKTSDHALRHVRSRCAEGHNPRPYDRGSCTILDRPTR